MKHLILPIVLIGITPLSALAQNSITQSNERVDEVITTGVYDRPQPSSTIPAAITIIDQNTLNTIAPIHPAEALNGVAGVNIHRGSGQEHLTAIRSPVLTGGAGAGSFLYLEGGVPLRAAGFANVNGLFEGGTEFAQALDVFKGPGPALYGSNAVHGLINIQPRAVQGPDTIRLIGSSDGLVSITASAATGPLRTSVSLVHDNGFRDDSGFDQQKFQLRYNGQWGLWNADWLSSFSNLNQETAGFLQGDDAFRDKNIARTNSFPEAFRDGRSYRTQLRLERAFGDNSLAITPYARRAELRFLRHFVPGQALEKNGHSSIGFQSAFFGDDFNIGLDAEYTEGSLFEFQANPTRFSFTQGLHYDYKVRSFVAAAYAQKDFHLGDKTTLGLGVRGEYTDYNYDNQASDGRSGRFIRVADRSDNFLTVTPKITLSHTLSNTVLLYARAARGSRAPQISDLYSVQLNQVAGEADVETLDSLEVGLKSHLHAWNFEINGFTQWKDNFFFRNANGFNVVNGKTRHSGIELSFKGAITSWLSLSGDGTLARHTYNFTEITGSAANNIIDGTRVDTAPDTLAHIRMSLTPLRQLRTELEWRHVGDYFTNPGNTARYEGHDIFVLRSDYQATDNLRLFARIDNLFDTRYADRADFAFGNERFFPGRPRSLFFGLSAQY